MQTLAHFGFSPREAKDGPTGIRLALAEPPDRILSDVRMPEINGYETLAAIRDLPGIASIPFTFLMAAIDKSDMRPARFAARMTTSRSRSCPTSCSKP